MKNHKSITNSFDRILSLKQNKSFLPPFFKLPSNRNDLNENRIDTRSSKLSSVTSDIRISFSGIEGWIGVPCRSRSRRIQIIKVRAVYKNQFIHWPRLWCTCGSVDRFNKWRWERGKQRGPDMVARERGEEEGVGKKRVEFWWHVSTVSTVGRWPRVKRNSFFINWK